MNADCGYLESALQGIPVQSFNVMNLMHVVPALRIKCPCSQSVEHERIIRIRGMSYSDVLLRAHGLPIGVELKTTPSETVRGNSQ